MAYPAIGLALILGFAIGAAVYIILANNDTDRYGGHQHSKFRVNEPVINLPPPPPRTQRRRKLRSCNICSKNINKNRVNFDCGHVYHTNCLKRRFRELFGGNDSQRPACIFCYKSTSELGQCCICCEDLITDQVKLPCGHMFHKNCIKEWSKTSPTCPLDRIPHNLSFL